MTLRERLERLLEDLPPGGSVTLPRSALEEMLEATDAPLEGREEPIADLTVAELAEELDRSESTVRGWCADDLIPEAYRLRGREWRIPQEAARRFLERERDGDEEGSRSPALGGADASLSDWRKHRN